MALAWMKLHRSKLLIFVVRRVSKVQSLLAPEFLGHFRPLDNPSDLSIRGTHQSDLLMSLLWCNGPIQKLVLSGF